MGPLNLEPGINTLQLLLTQPCPLETRVVVLVRVGVMLQAAAAAAANSACAVRAVAAGKMARSGAVGASRWVLNE